MNYRHEFHAGNFADVMKHAIVLQLVDRLARGGSISVFETHAGAGLYDLDSQAARRSDEAKTGVRRLLADADAPPSLAALRHRVHAANPDAVLRWYPGSASLIVGALRNADSYVGCELRSDDCARLDSHLELSAPPRGVQARALNQDGYEVVRSIDPHGPTLVLIDPPYERDDDYAQVVKVVALLTGKPDVSIAIWAPLKDLETFDALLRGLERLPGLPETTIAQVRVRPLIHPMRLNGCAMVLIGCPDIAPAAREVCDWSADAFADPGALARVYGLRD